MEEQSLSPIHKEKVLIIGGHSGIGEYTAKLLRMSRPDIDQCVPDRDILDVTSSMEIRACIRQEGPFSHIVYSAGKNQLAWSNQPMIEKVVDEMMMVNCTGFISIVSKHLMQFPGHGFSAVAVSSDAARIPMRGSVGYCATKAALDMAVRVLARETAPLCRINAVAPGMVDGTAMTRYIDQTIPAFRGWTPEHARNYERSNTPTQRRATLDEVARTVVWVLLGPWQMTGAIVDINGGR